MVWILMNIVPMLPGFLDVGSLTSTSVLAVIMSALRHKGRLFMHGSNARNFAMMNRTVRLFRSIQMRQQTAPIIIVIFTSRIHARKMITNNQWELVIMKNAAKICEMPRMMTLESGVVFVVRLVEERMIMHALTLLSMIVICAATKKITVATSMLVGIIIVPAARNVTVSPNDARNHSITADMADGYCNYCREKK